MIERDSRAIEGLPRLAGRVFTGAGALMLAGGVVMVFGDPAGFALVASGVVFIGAGQLARRLFAPPPGMRATAAEGFEAAVHNVDGTRGMRRQVTLIHVPEDATEAEIRAARDAWRRARLRQRPDWLRGRIESEDQRGGGTLKAAATVWTVFALGSALAALRWGGMALVVAIGSALIATALMVQVVLRALRLRRFGASTLALVRSPAAPGEVLEGRVRGRLPRDARLQGTVRVRIRCEHRREDTSRSGSRGREATRYRSDVLWEDAHGVEPTVDMDGALTVPVRFELPPDLPSATAAGGGAGIVWELDVHGTLDGLDYRASFRLPVFAAS